MHITRYNPRCPIMKFHLPYDVSVTPTWKFFATRIDDGTTLLLPVHIPAQIHSSLLFTCVRAGLYVGLVSSSWDNELTFLSAVETLVSCEKFDHLRHVWHYVTCVTTFDKCDQMWQLWPHVTNVTTCDKCDYMWQVWPHVTSVTTFDKCDHMWQVWPPVTSVTTCDKCDNMDMDIWTSWTFGHHGHLDIMDIRTSWTFGHHGHLDIMDIWTS